VLRLLTNLWMIGAMTAAVSVAEAPAAAARPGPGGRLDWRACPGSLGAHPAQRCAELWVPLDYRRPHGRQITITISRIPPPIRHAGSAYWFSAPAARAWAASNSLPTWPAPTSLRSYGNATT
jgi:hypothetical protein